MTEDNGMTLWRSVVVKLALLGVAVAFVFWQWPAVPEMSANRSGATQSLAAATEPDRPSAPAQAASGSRRTNRPVGKVDLNQATIEQLQALPGIGETLAQRVVHRRQAAGLFRSVDDLLQVKGIGRKRLEELRPLVVVSGPAGPPPRRASIPAAPAPGRM
jgi:competence protein ComEA